MLNDGDSKELEKDYMNKDMTKLGFKTNKLNTIAKSWESMTFNALQHDWIWFSCGFPFPFYLSPTLTSHKYRVIPICV
jgi:hypothetical protein